MPEEGAKLQKVPKNVGKVQPAAVDTTKSSARVVGKMPPPTAEGEHRSISKNNIS